MQRIIFCQLILFTIATSIDTSSNNCDVAVSKTPGISNNACALYCRTDPTAFAANCIYEPYLGSNPKGQCYRKWVPGWSEEAYDQSGQTYDPNFGRLVYASSAMSCQQQCQDDNNCAFFAFRPNKHICLLKTEWAVRSAVQTVFESAADRLTPPYDPRWKVCNMNLAWSCHVMGFKCLECEGSLVCAYEGFDYLSGPKYCQGAYDMCTGTFGSTTTTTPVATTPVATRSVATTPVATTPVATTPVATRSGATKTTATKTTATKTTALTNTETKEPGNTTIAPMSTDASVTTTMQKTTTPIICTLTGSTTETTETEMLTNPVPPGIILTAAVAGGIALGAATLAGIAAARRTTEPHVAEGFFDEGVMQQDADDAELSVPIGEETFA